jgi:hypothetical protein
VRVRTQTLNAVRLRVSDLVRGRAWWRCWAESNNKCCRAARRRARARGGGGS